MPNFAAMDWRLDFETVSAGLFPKLNKFSIVEEINFIQFDILQYLKLHCYYVYKKSSLFVINIYILGTSLVWYQCSFRNVGLTLVPTLVFDFEPWFELWFF